MRMTKKQVSKFLTVLTRVEALENELEPEASTRATPRVIDCPGFCFS
jgi:hypothetical protein